MPSFQGFLAQPADWRKLGDRIVSYFSPCSVFKASGPPGPAVTLPEVEVVVSLLVI